MRNPEYKDKLTEYSAADRAIMQASMNASRLANKKGTAKKAVAKKAVAKKVAPKPTDSRFSTVKKPSATKPTDSRFSGLGAGKPKPSSAGGYTPGSAKSGKSTYTTGSGVRYASATKKAAPAQKTKSLKKNPLVKFVTSRTGGKSGGYGNSK
jgi:DNA-binding protein HU-beta